MLVLGIDSSSSFLGLGLYGDNINNEILEDGGLTHSERLLPRMEDMFREANKKISDLDKIVVTIGPGSFTGIRIGVATANAFALGLDIPVVGVSTLEAMAYSLKDYDGLIISTMDAQGGCFYVLFAKFENEQLISLNSEGVYTKDEIIDFAKHYNKVIMAGDGLKSWECLPDFISISEVFSPDPLVLCEVGMHRVGETDFAEPVYIRKSQAEVEYDQRNGL